jgi:hypothetical protein
MMSFQQKVGSRTPRIHAFWEHEEQIDLCETGVVKTLHNRGHRPGSILTMTTLPKILLTVAVTGLTGGIIIDHHGVGDYLFLAVVLPLGAVAFGLFLIVFMLEKEVAKYDEEQAPKLQLLPCNTAPSPPRQKCPPNQRSFNSRKKHYENQTSQSF